MSLRLGYGTNGLTDLRLDDALALLADLGYDGVGLTLDHMHLDPLAPDLPARTRHVAQRLGQLGLQVTVETGARYVLDARRKHGPSLLDADPGARAARAQLLVTAVRVAGELGAHAVHCFSGVRPPDTTPQVAWQRLGQALAPVLRAAQQAVLLAIEPSPGTCSTRWPGSTGCGPRWATRRNWGSPWTWGTACAWRTPRRRTAYGPRRRGCGTSRSRTCAGESTNTCRSGTARSTSHPYWRP